MKNLCCLILFIAFSSNARAEDLLRINYLPPEGVVKNEKVAAAMAEILLSAVYGEEKIKKQRPLKVRHIDGDIWMISGSFNEPKGTNGGVAKIMIRQKDGAVLGMIHEK